MVDVLDKQGQALDPALKRLLDENAREDESDGKRDKSFVFCAACNQVLSRRKDAIDVNGSHHHFCTNPHGIDFNVRCYSDALGCAISGQATAADSWFAGFSWRFATCSSCSAHLGWLFENSAHDHFYGLIRERIQIDEAGGPDDP